MRKIIKKIEQDEQVMFMPVVSGKIISCIPTSCTVHRLLFTDGTEMTIVNTECDGRRLAEGDEVFVYGDILSNRELSEREIAQRKRDEQKKERAVFVFAGVFIAMMAALLVML